MRESCRGCDMYEASSQKTRAVCMPQRTLGGIWVKFGGRRSRDLAVCWQRFFGRGDSKGSAA
eukprot:5558585-Amphidinium_carterae.1